MRGKLKVAALFIGLMAIFALATAESCGDEGSRALEDQQESASLERTDSFARAEALHPVQPNENFPKREALVEYSTRTDQINHPWYIYILGDQGNIIGYYVGQTVPQSTCNFLSSTETVIDHDDSELVVTAPSLDGIYYGGGGASSACGMSFFMDYETDATIIVPSTRLFVTDAPLNVEADPITVTIE